MNPKAKLDLVSKIAQTDNNILLEEVQKLVDMTDSDKVYSLSKDQLEGISAAEDDIKYGKVMNHDEAKENTLQWFKK